VLHLLAGYRHISQGSKPSCMLTKVLQSMETWSCFELMRKNLKVILKNNGKYVK
jgi:hypothetical protein